MPGGTKKWFLGSADLQPLTVRNKVDLTVAASKTTTQEELKCRGAVASRATGTGVIVIEKGQVQGSRWMVTGNLGPVWITGDKHGLQKNVEASTNLSDLTSWDFPTAKDTRTNSNQSFWKDGGEVTTSLKDGTQMLDDLNKIKSHSMNHTNVDERGSPELGQAQGRVHDKGPGHYISFHPHLWSQTSSWPGKADEVRDLRELHTSMQG